MTQAMGRLPYHIHAMPHAKKIQVGDMCSGASAGSRLAAVGMAKYAVIFCSKPPPIAALSLTDLCLVLSLRCGPPRAFWYVLKK